MMYLICYKYATSTLFPTPKWNWPLATSKQTNKQTCRLPSVKCGQ